MNNSLFQNIRLFNLHIHSTTDVQLIFDKK